MWLSLLKGILQRPWIIALVAMVIFMGVQWTKIQVLNGKVTKLQGQVVLMEKNFNTCKSNEVSLNDAISKCNNETNEFTNNIKLLEDQVKEEKKRVVMWRDKYNNKVCYDPVNDNVTVKPDEARVLNDEKSVDAINRINDIFKP